MIYINGNDLTIEQVIAVSREGETVAIAPEADFAELGLAEVLSTFTPSS